MVNNFAEIAVRILERHSSVCNQPGKMHKGIRKLDHAGICEHANKLRLVDSVADDNQPPHPQQTFARQTRTAACVQDSCVLLVDTATPGWQIIWADRTWEHWSGRYHDTASNAHCSAVLHCLVNSCACSIHCRFPFQSVGWLPISISHTAQHTRSSIYTMGSAASRCQVPSSLCPSCCHSTPPRM